MAKSKGKGKKGGQIDEVVQCPHLHFKTDVIDRNVLSKEQHLNLLSTPKGYHWEEYKNEGGDGGPAEESPARRILCSGRRMKKAEKVYVHNFLAEVWNLLTPEMVDRLKGMLMNEFGMSPQEADVFISKQREENVLNSSSVSFYKKPRQIGDRKYVYDHVIRKRTPNKGQCDQFPKSKLGIRNSWIKDFSDFLAETASAYVLDTMCTERTERQQEIAQTLLNRFNVLLEQKTTIANPQTLTEKAIVIIADRLAMWLDKNVGVSKEAAEQLKILEEAAQRKKHDRKKKLDKSKKDRERKEAAERAKKLAAQHLADEQGTSLTGGEEAPGWGDEQEAPDGQVEGMTDEQKAEQAVEEYDQTMSIGEGEGKDEEPEDGMAGDRHEVTEQDGQPGTGGDNLIDRQPEGLQFETGDGKEQEEERELPEREAAAAAAAAAAVDSAAAEAAAAERKREEEEAAAAERKREEVAAAERKREEEASAANENKADDELKQNEDEKIAAPDATETHETKTEEGALDKKTEDELKKEEEDKAAAETAEVEKIRAEIKQEGAEKDAVEAELGKEELEEKGQDQEVDPHVAELEKQNAELDLQDAEKEAEKEAAEAEKLKALEQMKQEEEDKKLAELADKELEKYEKSKEEEKPAEAVTPSVAVPDEEVISPQEREQVVREVLKSVASIILETKVDPSPRQEAIKDIMEKKLEENLGDRDKEAIDKVASKVGTWIDKVVDQATAEYGQRESGNRLQGIPSAVRISSASQGVGTPASGRGQSALVPASDGGSGLAPGGVPAAPGVGPMPGGPVVGPQDGFVLDRIPGDTWGPRTSTGLQPTLVPGAQTSSSPFYWSPEGSRFDDARAPASRASPVSQKPKGRIYRVGRTDSSFNVNMISNTRAREKIRLARGTSPAFEKVPNPNGPMEPSDVKNWYKWTSALTEVAESWADWIKDTIKGTQQRGEQLSKDNNPDRMTEWKEFRDSRAQSARMWQQTKKDIEYTAEQWSKKGRSVQSQEANKFLRDQDKLAASTKPKSRKTLMKENQCDSATPMSVKNYLRKTFADITANEIEERIIHALCSPRSKQEVGVSQRLLKILTDVTGEQCTLQTPSNGMQRILVFTADQIAVWLINHVDNADKAVLNRREKRLDGIDDDGGKGDGNEEQEEDTDEPVQIIHRKKRPSGLDKKLEGSGDGAGEPGEKGNRKPKPAATSSNKKHEQDTRKAEPSGQRSNSRTVKKRPSEEKGDASKDRKKTSRDQPPSGESSKKGAGDKEKNDEKKSKTSQPQAGARGASESGRKEDTKRTASGNKPATNKEASGTTSSGKPGPKSSSSQNKTDVPRRSSQTSASQAGGKTGATKKAPSSEEQRASDSRRGSKSGEQRPRTASEQQRDRVTEIVSSHVLSLMKEGSSRKTPRAEALQDVISKKLMAGSKMALDQQALDAIKDASVLLAAYIDKQAENVELEYGAAPPPHPLAQRGKGPVFTVKPVQSTFAVRQVTHYDAAQKVAESRGRPKPGAITLSKGGFDPKETKEWAKWASDVVSMADKWSKWIDSTVSTAVASAEKKKAGQEVPGWRNWKETTGEEALEWRRNKKLLSQSAALFQDKLDRTMKPQSAPTKGAHPDSKDPPKKK